MRITRIKCIFQDTTPSGKRFNEHVYEYSSTHNFPYFLINFELHKLFAGNLVDACAVFCYSGIFTVLYTTPNPNSKSVHSTASNFTNVHYNLQTQVSHSNEATD